VSKNDLNSVEERPKLNAGSETLFANLRKFRSSESIKKKLPAYCIFHDSTLILIANARPTNNAELLRIKGLGKQRIEEYGDQIIEIVLGSGQ
jgi:DNA helicase-2/ATP-dependent DNA helicase PcrA